MVDISEPVASVARKTSSSGSQNPSMLGTIRYTAW